ncbi:MAG TPA: KpsF/GutQ family sugar-phosphate isomerase, partial [Usitatibacter sp.]
MTNLLQPHALADAEHFLELARGVLDIEADAVRALKGRLGEAFLRAHRMILETKGRVVVTGMGKSGHVARKIASTLASTGTPAFFMHPAEASHGDLGMITSQDVVIAISYSGESDEIMKVLPVIKRRGAKVIAITGRAQSTLATEADVHLDAGVEKEACPLDLAPTASTTATLALGDALAMALLEARGFKSDDFAMHHPGGALGRRLLVHVSDIMRKGEHLPKNAPGDMLPEVILEMSKKGIGMTCIVDAGDGLLGIYTDGDL